MVFDVALKMQSDSKNYGSVHVDAFAELVSACAWLTSAVRDI